MNATTTWVGMDVHAETISWAIGLPTGRVVEMRTDTKAGELRSVLRKLRREAPGLVQTCYEAGPTGFGLQRLCESEGVACDVIAPSLIPVKPGERVKTDRLDARKLMELLRAGQLTAVQAPTPEEEAARSVIRRLRSAKEDSARAPGAARQHRWRSALFEQRPPGPPESIEHLAQRIGLPVVRDDRAKPCSHALLDSIDVASPIADERAHGNDRRVQDLLGGVVGGDDVEMCTDVIAARFQVRARGNEVATLESRHEIDIRRARTQAWHVLLLVKVQERVHALDTFPIAHEI